MYLILNDDSTVKEAVPSHKNIEWDSTHFCRPDKLTEEEAAMFRVVYLNDPVKPSCDPLTEEAVHTGYHQEVGGWHWTFEVRPLTPEVAASNVQQAVATAIQELLDSTARQPPGRYDSIHTACGWADKFPDAAAIRDWGAACWVKAGEIEAAVTSGTRPLPSVAEVLAEMPAFVAL